MNPASPDPAPSAAATGGPAQPGPPVPRLTGRALAGICGVYFLSRLLVIGAAAIPRLILLPGPHFDPVRSWIERFKQWDSNWYLEIATDGYHFNPHGASSVAFYPLYPLLIRALSWCGVDPLVAGYAISHAALFGACLYLWRLAALETRSATVANLAVTFLLLNPGAAWFGLIYTESLFLLTLLGCLYAARRGRPLEAAVWGYAAAITRTPGLLLAGFLLLEAAQQWWETRGGAVTVPLVPTGPAADRTPGRVRARRWPLPTCARLALAAAGPVLGQLTFLIFLQVAFGDWHAQQKTMTAGWFADGPRWPWDALIVEWHWSNPLYTVLADPVLAVVLAAAAASFWSLRRWGYPALVLTLTTLYLVSTNGDSLLRYLSTAAPVYIVLAQAAQRSRLLETTIIGVSVAIMVLITLLLANGYMVL